MCNLFNITWIDLKGFWSIWMFALLVVSGLFCTSMCMYVADEASPMRDVMVIMLGGNGEGHPYSFLTVIVSLIPLSILLLWRGGYLEAELHQRCYYSILRTGNMSVWTLAKMINCLVISLLYVLMLLFLICLLAPVKPFSENQSLFLFSEMSFLISTPPLCFMLFSIIQATTILLIQLFTMLAFVNSRFSASFILLYTLCCFALPQWMAYLPVGSTLLAQGLARGQTYFQLFVISLVYILLLAIGIVIVCRKKIFLSKTAL